jgi:CDP-glucose 4,6-dehydratase
MNLDFWQGKRVFVTGHTGFKGGWLSLWLQQMGARVTGYALAPSTQPNLFDVAHVGGGMHSIIADVRDFNTLRAALHDAQPDIVFHLAAQPLVRYSYANPRETYETNVMGTVNLLDALRTVACVRAAVIVTSDKCYENREWEWGYRENEPMGGHDPYSNSKGCAELVTAAMRDSYFGAHGKRSVPLSLASARAGNVIGGGDWSEDRLIPDIVRSIAAGRPVQIRNPHAIRPWQHVLEPLSGYLLLAERLHGEGAAYASAWNFGPSDDDAQTVEWIVDRLVSRWGQSARWERDGGEHPHEATYLKLDSSKARMHLGWRPRLHLDETLSWLLDWYKAHREGLNMQTYTNDQIRRFAAHQS